MSKVDEVRLLFIFSISPADIFFKSLANYHERNLSKNCMF